MSITQIYLFPDRCPLCIIGFGKLQVSSLEHLLFNIKSRTVVLQWTPFRYGLYCYDQADILAKQCAGQLQKENPVCLSEMVSYQIAVL